MIDLQKLADALVASDHQANVHPSGYFMATFQGEGLITWNGKRENGALMCVMLDLLEKGGVAGVFGAVEVFVANQKVGGYICERWLVPNGDTPVMMQSGEGETRCAAVAECLIAAVLSQDGGAR